MTDPDPSPPAPLVGYVDLVDWRRFSGWAFEPEQPQRAVWLEIVVDDQAPQRFLANLHRADLARDGIGTGRHGFDLRFPKPLDPRHAHEIAIRRASDGQHLVGSPWSLPAAPAAGPIMRARFESDLAAEIEGARTGPELEPATRFLLAQLDRLLQARADLESGEVERRAFRLRWADHLEGPRPDQTPPDPRRRALIIGPALPPPDAQLVSGLSMLPARVLAVAAVDLAMLPPDSPPRGYQAVGAPLHHSVEDVLKRHAGQFSIVLLLGCDVAATYALVARRHQPRARILAWFGEETDTNSMLLVCAMLTVDAVLVPSTEVARRAAGRFAGRGITIVPQAASSTEVASLILRAIDPKPVSPQPVSPRAPAGPP